MHIVVLPPRSARQRLRRFTGEILRSEGSPATIREWRPGDPLSLEDTAATVSRRASCSTEVNLRDYGGGNRSPSSHGMHKAFGTNPSTRCS